MADYFWVGTFDKPSWHKKEQGLLTHNDVWQAMQTVGMDTVEFHKLQSFAQWHNEYLPVEGKFQLVMVGMPWAPRTAKPLGRQVTTYEPLQHRFMAELVQPLIDMSAGAITLKGVAQIGRDAEISFVQLDLGEFHVADDPDEAHKSYLLLADNKQKGATNWLNTNVRVVCNNTYTVAVEGAPAIPHGETGTMFLNFHAAMLEQAMLQKAQEEERLTRLFRTPVTKDQVEHAVKAVFPDPGATPAMRNVAAVVGEPTDPRIVKMLKQAEADTNRLASQFMLAAGRRAACMTAIEQFNDERPQAADTAYAFFQGVTYVVNHSEDFTGDEWKQEIALVQPGGQKNTMIANGLRLASEMAGVG